MQVPKIYLNIFKQFYLLFDYFVSKYSMCMTSKSFSKGATDAKMQKRYYLMPTIVYTVDIFFLLLAWFIYLFVSVKNINKMSPC